MTGYVRAMCMFLALGASFIASAGEFSTAAISGHVVNADSSPVPGAVVYVVDEKHRLTIRNDAFTISEHLPRAITDADGKFHFRNLERPPRVLLARDLEDRFAFICLAKPIAEAKIVMQAPAQLSGRLLRGRSPLSHKQVTATLQMESFLVRFFRTTDTDASGEFHFSALPPGKYLLQTIDPVPQVGCCFRNVVTNQLQVDLTPGVTRTVRIGGSDLPWLRGRIADIKGNPLHGVWVHLSPNLGSTRPATQPESIGVQSVWADVTAKDGSYAIYDIPPGPYVLRCFRRLAQNNYARTLQDTRPVTIVRRSTADGRQIPQSENVLDVIVDLAPFMPLELGGPAPRLVTRTLSGDPFDLARHRGKAVVIHFYTSLCSACTPTLALYDKLVDRFGSENLAILGVNLDQTQAACTAFLADKRLRHPQCYDGPFNKSAIAKAFRVVNAPTTIIIDPKGNVAQVDLFEDVLEDFLDTLLHTPTTTSPDLPSPRSFTR